MPKGSLLDADIAPKGVPFARRLTFRLKDVDRVAFARALATRIDWKRDASIWSALVTEKEGKDGQMLLSFLGAGASTRRAIVKIIRDEMGLSERLEQLGSDEE